MTVEQIKKQNVQRKWTRENVLTSEQRKELIMSKVLRAQEQLQRHRRQSVDCGVR